MATLGNINLYVQNVERAAQFYVQVIGLTQDEERSAPPGFILLNAGSCTITLQDGTAPGAVFGKADSVELGFEVSDLDAALKRLNEQGVKVSELQRMGWGSGFDTTDLDGHHLTIYKMASEHA